MELGLSLGHASKSFVFMDKSHQVSGNKGGLGALCMGLSVGPSVRSEEDFVYKTQQDDDLRRNEENQATTPATTSVPKKAIVVDCDKRSSADVDPPIQLDLLPNTPVPRSLPSFLAFRWPSDNGSSEAASSWGQMARGFDVNKFPLVEEPDQDGAALSSSPNNSATSSLLMDFCFYSSGGNNMRDFETSGGLGNEIEAEPERASSRVSDEDENGCTRKKLRLSKEQSAFLEESFKEHNTLNPKQKLALAKELNLRPRQVEVWFQNRRARTKLKQTEVDCEYLKRCCETLTEENRRLHKELQELRALKTSNQFYMQLPATTLTMCPSCERVATTTTNTNPSAAAGAATTTAGNSSDPTSTKAPGFSLSRPKFFPFSQNQQPTS